MSRKKAKRIRQSAGLRVRLRELRGSDCELRIRNVCTGQEQGLHHLKKKSQGGEDTAENCKLSCNACNRWVEDHPIQAEAFGLVIRRNETWSPAVRVIAEAKIKNGVPPMEAYTEAVDELIVPPSRKM